VDLMAALKASLAAGGGDGERAEEGTKKRPAASGRKSKSKDQLSIEQAKLRGVEGSKKDGEQAAEAEEEEEAAPARSRRRKAS